MESFAETRATNPDVRDCCKQADNLAVVEQTDDLVTRKCQVCGSRHFELSLEPTHFNLVF